MAGRARKWTPEEDAFLRENREHGPSWQGYREALPDRTEPAIATRRNTLGITFKHGERRGAYNKGWSRMRYGAEPPQRQSRFSSEPWSDEQRVALVRLATEMVDACDHDLRECLQELARVIGEHRKRRRDGTDA